MDAVTRLAPYFDLQLRFAARLAEVGGPPLGEAVTWYTNLHRRFGLGMARRDQPASALWRRLLDGLGEAPDHAARLAWTLECFAAAPPEQPPPGQHRFGCFACDAPDGSGVLKLHFSNADGDDVSPLAEARRARRRAELTAMFAFVAANHPDAASVRGTSWLYHLEAYRRLYPPGYAASRRPPDRPLHFHGSSSWGQFLDHRGAIKPAARDRMLVNLPALNPLRLREAFPLPALLVTAPIDEFLRYYGVR